MVGRDSDTRNPGPSRYLADMHLSGDYAQCHWVLWQHNLPRRFTSLLSRNQFEFEFKLWFNHCYDGSEWRKFYHGRCRRGRTSHDSSRSGQCYYNSSEWGGWWSYQCYHNRHDRDYRHHYFRDDGHHYVRSSSSDH